MSAVLFRAADSLVPCWGSHQITKTCVYAMSLLQVRSIQFNLKDASNPDLRRRVMTGEVDPQVRHDAR
jgi:hypothetical protein